MDGESGTTGPIGRFGSRHVERYGLFLTAMMLFGIGVGLFYGVRDNYLAWLGVGKAGRGVVEFFRELPGLLLLLLLAPFYRQAERHIIRFALGISALGILGFLLVGTNVALVVVCLTIWSIGEHLVMPVRRSYAIHSAETGQEGRALGFLMGLENAGRVTGFAVVPLIFAVPAVRLDRDAGGRAGFMVVFAAVGAALILAFAVALMLAGTKGQLERKRLYIRRKFMRYYGLEVFYGARKQVFFTFAPYLLILHYGAQTEYLASLLGICALINIFMTPVIGRVIDRIGYRMVMIGDTVILFFVCLAYGFAHRIFPGPIAFGFVTAIFIIDSIVSGASMASSVYVSRISKDKEEMTSTLSTGISVNHLFSVAIALIGGVIWEALGVEILFITAAVMAVGNTLFAMTIPKIKSSSRAIIES
ncbi:MAG: MFS transporter [Spirochaetaceae bacterium]|nr:MFS transporter [Spirochaetaceae bacterium]